MVTRTYILEFGLAMQFLAEMSLWVSLIFISFRFLIQRFPCIKIVIEVFRKGQKKANTPETQRKYAKASINRSLSPFLGRPLFLFDSNHQRLEKEYGLWALLRLPNVLPLFGLLNHPAIPSIGIMAPHCTLGNLRVFFSDSARASVNRPAIVRVTLRA